MLPAPGNCSAASGQRAQPEPWQWRWQGPSLLVAKPTCRAALHRRRRHRCSCPLLRCCAFPSLPQLILLCLKLDEMENVESVSLPGDASYCMTVRRRIAGQARACAASSRCWARAQPLPHRCPMPPHAGEEQPRGRHAGGRHRRPRRGARAGRLARHRQLPRQVRPVQQAPGGGWAGAAWWKRGGVPPPAEWCAAPDAALDAACMRGAPLHRWKAAVLTPTNTCTCCPVHLRRT